MYVICKSFTIVELMVVIAVLALITVAAVPAYGKYRDKAKINEIFTYIRSVQLQVEQYYAVNGVLPPDNTFDYSNITTVVPEDITGIRHFNVVGTISIETYFAANTDLNPVNEVTAFRLRSDTTDDEILTWYCDVHPWYPYSRCED